MPSSQSGPARWSKGCPLCVKRRVKCDEKRPGCGNCQKYGKECPGYTRELIFLQARTHRRPKAARQSELLPSSSASSAVTISHPIPSPHLYQTQLAFKTGDVISREYRLVWTWFRLLPDMTGRSRALDSAVRSFSVGILARAYRDERILHEGHRSYVDSLSLLQQALYHPRDWRLAETLCAAILLCLFEFLAGTTSADDYNKHIQGIGSLIEMRGPHPHEWTPFEVTMVQTFRGPLIIGELFVPHGCTLVQDKWRTFFRNGDPGDLPDVTPPELRGVQEDYFDVLSQMPHITHRGYDLLLAVSAGKPVDAAGAADLVLKTINAYDDWQNWIEKLFDGPMLPPEEIPSPRGDSQFPTVYKYDDPWKATGYIVALSCMLICNMVFMATGYGGDRSAEGKDLLDKICKSVETVAEGPCGPYRVSFGLRIGFEAATPEVREWIKGWLHDFEARFKAADVETYPKITAAEMLSAS